MIYIPPEMVRDHGYNGTAHDVWSAGVCLWALIYGSMPFKQSESDKGL